MKSIPIPLLTFLAVQIGGGIWWASNIDGAAKHAEELAVENRRYIQEAIMPSYEIGANWDNPHHNNWVKAGGWND